MHEDLLQPDRLIRDLLGYVLSSGLWPYAREQAASPDAYHNWYHNQLEIYGAV
jgi:hypothetical protein